MRRSGSIRGFVACFFATDRRSATMWRRSGSARFLFKGKFGPVIRACCRSSRWQRFANASSDDWRTYSLSGHRRTRIPKQSRRTRRISRTVLFGKASVWRLSAQVLAEPRSPSDWKHSFARGCPNGSVARRRWSEILRGYAVGTIRRARGELARRAIVVRLGMRVIETRISQADAAAELVFDDDSILSADIIVWATAAAPPSVLENYRLPKTDDGFLAVARLFKRRRLYRCLSSATRRASSDSKSPRQAYMPCAKGRCCGITFSDALPANRCARLSRNAGSFRCCPPVKARRCWTTTAFPPTAAGPGTSKIKSTANSCGCIRTIVRAAQ